MRKYVRSSAEDRKNETHVTREFVSNMSPFFLRIIALWTSIASLFVFRMIVIEPMNGKILERHQAENNDDDRTHQANLHTIQGNNKMERGRV